MKADKLDYDKVLERANELYCKEKLKHVSPSSLSYMAPELFPQIQSDQVKSILQALVEAINNENIR